MKEYCDCSEEMWVNNCCRRCGRKIVSEDSENSEVKE